MTSKHENNTDILNRAKEYALRYLSYRPRSSWEMSMKLAEKGYDDTIIALVMMFLKEQHFIDDENFARIWLSNRTKGKPCGRRRIYAELMQKRLDTGIIEQCLTDLSAEREEQMARALVENKCRKDAFHYVKLKNFLLRRGFDTAVIRKVLSEYDFNCLDKMQ